MKAITEFLAAPFRIRASDLCGGPFEPGDVAKARRRRGLSTHMFRRVYIVSCVRVMDQQRVAASLEQSVDFADGCYYVNSWFCRCRRVGSTEAPCIHLGGVRGDGRDEAFVQRLAATMHAESKTRQVPKTMQSYKQAASASLAGTGSHCWCSGGYVIRRSHRHGATWQSHLRARSPMRGFFPLEEEDVALLAKVAKSAESNDNGAVTLPLFAYTQKQWNKDLGVRDKQRHGQERARNWVAQRPQASKPKRVSSSSSTSSSPSSSTSSSYEAAAAPTGFSGGHQLCRPFCCFSGPTLLFQRWPALPAVPFPQLLAASLA